MATAGPFRLPLIGASTPPYPLSVSGCARLRVVRKGKRGRWGVMLVALTAAPGAAHALGLGPLEVRSSLGEPLQAVAPLHIGANESVEKIETSLADRQTYRDFGMSPPALATRLRLQVVPNPRPHITITSVEPVRAPMFNLLVRAGEQGTALLKEYTLALDPPGQGANEPEGGMGERAASTPQPVVKAGPEPETKEAKQGAGGAPGAGGRRRAGGVAGRGGSCRPGARLSPGAP